MTDKKGIYIHIPFCVKKCNYCSFNSYENMFKYEDEYTDALIKQIKNSNDGAIDTIYIGGGTPSAIKEENIAKILGGVFSHFDVKKDAEITIEVNPGTVNKEKIKSYKQNGINRISIGSQDFSGEGLKTLGRIHTADDIYTAFEIAYETGINNVSLDLMYAFFGQTVENLKKSLKKIISLNPEHISTYALSIEEGTPFFESVKNKKYSPLSDETYSTMYETICTMLKGAGYKHYEISNFAKEGYHSRHNTLYWKCNEYFGFGAGASGYINNERFKMTSDILSYINNPLLKEETDLLNEKDKMSEFVILGLRMTDGIDKNEFCKRFETDIYDVFKDELDKHINITKMIHDKNGRIYLDKKAYFVSNIIFSDFI